MKIYFIALTAMFVLVTLDPSYAQLDLEQEVISVPDTHDTQQYIWNAVINPSGYKLSTRFGAPPAGENAEFSFSIVPPEGETFDEKSVHVFITDMDMQVYEHVRPERSGSGMYHFTFSPPLAGRYRVEVIFRTEYGWADMVDDFRTKGGKAQDRMETGEYDVQVRMVPEKAYTGHVATFLYEIRKNGTPVSDLDKIDGLDMQVASWDRRLNDFIYATPRQNTGGPKVAVSIVFRNTGMHRVFAEYRHNGKVQKFIHTVDVGEEAIKERGPGSGTGEH
ncbi:MAG: hypothetical protein C4560_08310 [Nitrospiraceae bacterium]|nr:MAG: hypothetical protein C4560_08310 [Nitrospiraceae bacterium]